MEARSKTLFGWGIVPTILLIGFAVLYGATIRGIWQQNSDELDAQKKNFDRIRSIASYAPNLAKLDVQAGTPADLNLFLPGETTAIVSAQLLANLKQLAANHGLQVMRAQGMPEKPSDDLTFVGGSFDVSGLASGIYGLIQDIEASKPYLFIDKLEIHAGSPMGPDANSDTILNVSLQVSGAIRNKTDTPIKAMN